MSTLGQTSVEDHMRAFYISDDVTADDAGQQALAVLVLGGEVDYEVSPQLRTHLVRAIKAGRSRLVLDLTDVTFIDSTAIGVIAGAVERLDPTRGGSLAVVCTHEKVLEIFEITGLDTVITVHASRDDAISALTPTG
jgi:anti-sigma B factor antagonist